MQKDDQEKDCDQEENGGQTHQKNIEEKMIRKKPPSRSSAKLKRAAELPAAEKLAVFSIASYNKNIHSIFSTTTETLSPSDMPRNRTAWAGTVTAIEFPQLRALASKAHALSSGT